MLVRLSLIEQIIKDANTMEISFSVRHSQTCTLGNTGVRLSQQLLPKCISTHLTRNWLYKHSQG